MSARQLELELWITREKLAEVTLELWQYRRIESQQHIIRVADELKQIEGTQHGD